MPLLGARGRTRRAAGDRLIDARGGDGPSPRGQLGCGRTLGIMDLPDRLVDLLQAPSLCFITTLMPDGSPHITQTWVDTDGKNIIINTVQGFQKVRNIQRDPRVAVAIADAQNPSRYLTVRGRVVDVTEEGGAEHIDQLAHKYMGKPYPWFGGRDQVRVILTIEADKVTGIR
jgi:PPOX class probable F420-dependent enzyme